LSGTKSVSASLVEIEVFEEDTYLIRVGGWSFPDIGDGIVTLPLDTGILGDIDGDGDVDVTDLLLVIAAWGTSGADGTDLDGDGIVAVGDILILIANWS